MQTNDLLRATARISFDVGRYAILLHSQFGEYFLPNPEGIYKVGEVDPCIVPNKVYYSSFIRPDGSKQIDPITDFSKVTDNVITEDDIVVIPAFMMKAQSRYLSNTPIVPTRAVLIVMGIINSYLSSISKYTQRNVYGFVSHDHMRSCIETDDIIRNGYLERICEPLTNELGNFIGNDIWHIYIVTRNGLQVTVEKTIDYRIYKYHEDEASRIELAKY